MPELPEVEVVRVGLQDHIVGRTIASVEVLHPRAIRRHLPGAVDFVRRSVGERVVAARRRGKYLWLELSGGEAALGHLGMSGQLLVRPYDAPDETHLRIRFRFDDRGSELRFVDQRTFGGFLLGELSESHGILVPKVITHIAPDPMDSVFELTTAVSALRARRTEVKRALLDQTVVSGIGNIYADEALWRAQVHYARAANRLSQAQAVRVLVAAAAVMAEALQAGGTSFDALYVNVNGRSGYFERSLNVYGRAGLPCARCGGPIQRDPFMNRSSYFCPRCQLPPRRAR